MRQTAICLGTFVLLGCWGVAKSWADEKPPAVKVSKEEQMFLDMTNKARVKEKLPPLKVNPILFKIARLHSANMARQEKLEHTLDGKTAGRRARDAGYGDGWVGENIAQDGTWSPPDLFQAWMDSKPHRENILHKRYTEIGIGIARSDKGEWYFTQVFGHPPRR